MNKNISTNKEKRFFICDICDQEFEIDYMCEKCSDKIIEEETEVPNLQWNGLDTECEFITEIEPIWIGDVCLNCCNCKQK
jgi:hypothetical protein